MSKTMENVKTVNSVVRTGLMVTILAILGYAGWYTYAEYIEPSQRAEQAMKDLETLKAQYEVQAKELEETKAKNVKLETSNRLLKVDHRLANIHVTKKDVNEEGEPYFEVTFEEVDPYYGNPVSEPREFTLRGNKLYVDCWVCTFDDKYVEDSDELRNATLCIFKTIFGELDGVKGGFSLDREDENGDIRAPGIYYRGVQYTDFEKKIWDDFWVIANDPKLQDEMGIRASFGQIDYITVEEGRSYQVEVRASSGTSIKSLGTQVNQ